jgi:CBS domain-containing protein
MVSIDEFMTKGVITIDSTETAVKAAEIMTAKDVGSLIVMRGEDPVGIVTESDLIRKVASKKKDPEKVKIHEIMTEPLIKASVDMNIKEVARLMRDNRIRRIPIVDKGKLVGIVTSSDFAWLYR